MFYTYRSTTEKLPDALQHIEESGDVTIHMEYVGGRDWLLVCRKGPVRTALRGSTARPDPGAGR